MTQPTDSGPPPPGPALAVGEQEFHVLSYELPSGADTPGLSAAEREVIAMLLGGLRAAEIARHRGTSIRTTRNQIARIYDKLDVTSAPELMANLVGAR